jgi:transcription initiation factor TFIID subunit 8
MAPMSPINRKRASPSDSQSDSGFDEPSSKRQRTESVAASPQTIEKDILATASLERSRMFDDDPHQLLLRSIALALEHVGFEAASPEALEAFCAEVDTC